MCKTGALSRVISTDCELTSSPFGKGLPICLLSGHMYKGHFIDAIILPFETLRRILFMNQICYGEWTAFSESADCLLFSEEQRVLNCLVCEVASFSCLFALLKHT